MAVTPRNINFKHKLITHKIKMAPHMCAQSADVRVIKTHHLATNTTHAIHDTVKSHILMCFKYFRGSERAPQTKRSAHMKTLHEFHQLHRGVSVHACTAASPNHIHILHTSNSCEVGVHSARSAVARSNNNNNMALAATHHRDAVLHPSQNT